MAAPPARVHALICHVEAWALWSPHVASVDPPRGRLHPGWRGRVRAFFSPVPTEMVVDAVHPDGGMEWHSRGLGHVLRYENRVAPEGAGSRVTFTARVDGPLGPVLTRLAAPLSALGQRRRLARLDRLASLLEQAPGDGDVATGEGRDLGGGLPDLAPRHGQL